jgi:hypothetical protein
MPLMPPQAEDKQPQASAGTGRIQSMSESSHRMAPAPWDPFGTIASALWIGGAQWAGKSTVARLLAVRYGLTAYHCDYHDARAHDDRRVAARVRRGEPPAGPAAEEMWVSASPAEMAASAVADFAARFDWTLDDLRALVSARPIVAEGWSLRPDLVARVPGAVSRMVVLVPTEEFRRRQLAALPRAGRIGADVSDPVRAQRNRVERDRILAADAVGSARRLGVPVIEVDGSQDAAAVADVVADHFRACLSQ